MKCNTYKIQSYFCSTPLSVPPKWKISTLEKRDLVAYNNGKTITWDDGKLTIILNLDNRSCQKNVFKLVVPGFSKSKEIPKILVTGKKAMEICVEAICGNLKKTKRVYRPSNWGLYRKAVVACQILPRQSLQTQIQQVCGAFLEGLELCPLSCGASSICRQTRGQTHRTQLYRNSIHRGRFLHSL